MEATINSIFESYLCGVRNIFPPSHGLRLALDLMEYTSKTSRCFSAITLSANNLRESGACNYQSVGWAIAE
ncbi:MAG: hypothetical protein HY730_05415 [Candidatus Tectomicrobia bacterium]|uniref:Methylmalonyl-CoA mutase alpha/beta chain catalytic domain-containing protein n=1 Tax=Tectimicrobiota bacterium TaxID=2528274 RepID=A0A933GKZ9_UNCTE|nr:hypothetical protein [Candidatus Tectomicrobia bacterium]